MAPLTFANTHNMIAFLTKFDASEGFDQIVDFLNAHTIHMVRNVDSPSKFLMYPWFLQVMINAQIDDLSSHNTKYTSPALTQKVFANIKRIGKGYSGVETPLFNTMLVQPQVQDADEVEEYKDNNEALEFVKLKQRVKKLEKKRRSKSSGLKRRMHLNKRKIAKLDADEDVTLVDVDTTVGMDADTQGRMEEDVIAVKEVNAAEPTVFDDEEENEDLERAKVLQQQYDQKKKNINWNVVAEQMQEKHLDNIKKYQSLKRKPIFVAQTRKNMIVYLKNMARYKIQHFKDVDGEPTKKRAAKETLLQESFKKLNTEVEVLALELRLFKTLRKCTKELLLLVEELVLLVANPLYMLRDKDLLKSKDPQAVVAAAKISILNPNEFNLWKMRIEQYFLMTAYSLWEVMLNGDSPTPTKVVDGVVQAIALTTADTNESVSVVPSVSVASTKTPVSTLPNVDNLSDAVIYSFFASQSNNPQLDNEDLKQIDADDLDEMNLKWQMAMLTTRGHFARECMSPKDTKNKDTQRRIVSVETSNSNALVSQCDGVGSDNEVAPCSKACSKAFATLQSHYDKLTVDFRKSQFDVLSYKSGLEYVEARLVVYQQNENVFEEDIKLLKLDVMLRDNALIELKKKFKKAEKEKDDLESDDSVPTSPVRDRYKSGEGYHAVPHPYTGTFMPLKPDLVFHDAPTVSETVLNVFHVEPSTTKPNKDMSQSNKPSAPVIEDWVSDSKDESEGEPMPTQKAPSFVQTSKHVKTPRTFVKPVEHPTQAENLRKDISKSRGHKHSWNRKACFVCKSLNHLIKDCDFYEKQMVQKPVRNHSMRFNH
nr:hypothetical protein [Tanacetum cinerariifolium]